VTIVQRKYQSDKETWKKLIYRERNKGKIGQDKHGFLVRFGRPVPPPGWSLGEKLVLLPIEAILVAIG
jgi:hypothetical protein